MPKTIAIFGAGPGLGLSIGRQFGRAGFRVALVARNPERLDGLVTDLAESGITAAGFVADLADTGQLAGAVTAITGTFGAIDVLEYSPGGMSTTGTLAEVRDVDVDSLEGPLDLLLRAPVFLAGQVLPGMIERGDGALLLTVAVSAIRPVPQAGNFGMIMAAARNYLQGLNVALAGQGVYAGTMTVSALIERSDVQRYVDSLPAGPGPAAGAGIVRVDPDDLAGTWWDMYTRRDRSEEVIGQPAMSAGSPSSGAAPRR